MQRSLYLLLIGVGVIGMMFNAEGKALGADVPAIAPSTKSPVAVPAYVNALMQVTSLDARAVGVAAVKSQNYAAFEAAIKAQVQARGTVGKQAAQVYLQRVIQQGTPAGKIYAATVLQKVNATAGATAFKQLQMDQSIVVYRNGCVPNIMTVSQVASLLALGRTMF